ncbi:CLUMA_CG017362, isoform A [Clunio marinus]|uniref:CLUMA_CG017362, isoform A n=1 Tax=Clunio marinus TaxID=568069 RepID=A0A1J1IVR0_9DIPT|nr:CLUMA_CG017362, isoform A [Clunio marinus]
MENVKMKHKLYLIDEFKQKHYSDGNEAFRCVYFGKVACFINLTSNFTLNILMRHFSEMTVYYQTNSKHAQSNDALNVGERIISGVES